MRNFRKDLSEGLKWFEDNNSEDFLPYIQDQAIALDPIIEEDEFLPIEIGIRAWKMTLYNGLRYHYPQLTHQCEILVGGTEKAPDPQLFETMVQVLTNLDAYIAGVAYCEFRSQYSMYWNSSTDSIPRERLLNSEGWFESIYVIDRLNPRRVIVGEDHEYTYFYTLFQDGVALERTGG